VAIDETWKGFQSCFFATRLKISPTTKEPDVINIRVYHRCDEKLGVTVNVVTVNPRWSPVTNNTRVSLAAVYLETMS